MPLFGEQASPFDPVVEKATNETNTGENWALILDICDRVAREGTKGAKAFMLSVKKRLNNRDPHVVLLALSVLDSAVSNCGSLVLNEICTREFIAELQSKCVTSNRGVAEKCRILVKKWSDEHRDASFSLLASLVKELKQDGYSFESSEPPKSRRPAETTDPNFVSSAEEEAAIAKAIAASLKESPVVVGGGSAAASRTSNHNNSTSSGLHSLSNGASLYPTNSQPSANRPTRPVKALYDFEAAEDNELTFKAGELITVTDDSDMNWWRGTNSRGEGLFPANFVTPDLSASVVSEEVTNNADKRSVQFDDNVQVKELEKPVVIDEAVINRCLELLDDADPTGEVPDSDELLQLEDNCQRQMPLIDDELSAIDARYNQLADVDIRLRDALALYDTCMQQASQQKFAQMPAASLAAAHQHQTQPGMLVQPPASVVASAAYSQPQYMAVVPQSSQAVVAQQSQVYHPQQQQQQQQQQYYQQQQHPQQVQQQPQQQQQQYAPVPPQQ